MTQTTEAPQQDSQQNQTSAQQTPDTATTVQTADLPEAVVTQPTGSPGSIDILLDMQVPLTVVLGKTQLPVRRLLQLAPGSVVRLDKPVDAPAEIYLEDRLFAKGIIVVVDDNFALRITHIIATGDSDTQQPKL